MIITFFITIILSIVFLISFYFSMRTPDKDLFRFGIHKTNTKETNPFLRKNDPN